MHVTFWSELALKFVHGLFFASLFVAANVSLLVRTRAKWGCNMTARVCNKWVISWFGGRISKCCKVRARLVLSCRVLLLIIGCALYLKPAVTTHSTTQTFIHPVHLFVGLWLITAWHRMVVQNNFYCNHHLKPQLMGWMNGSAGSGLFSSSAPFLIHHQHQHQHQHSSKPFFLRDVLTEVTRTEETSLGDTLIKSVSTPPEFTDAALAELLFVHWLHGIILSNISSNSRDVTSF